MTRKTNPVLDARDLELLLRLAKATRQHSVKNQKMLPIHDYLSASEVSELDDAIPKLEAQYAVHARAYEKGQTVKVGTVWKRLTQELYFLVARVDGDWAYGGYCSIRGRKRAGDEAIDTLVRMRVTTFVRDWKLWGETPFVCPVCSAEPSDHGKGACADKEGSKKRRHCLGFLCGCTFEPDVDGHGMSQAHACQDARCHHCGWKGVFPVPPSP